MAASGNDMIAFHVVHQISLPQDQWRSWRRDTRRRGARWPERQPDQRRRVVISDNTSLDKSATEAMISFYGGLHAQQPVCPSYASLMKGCWWIMAVKDGW